MKFALGIVGAFMVATFSLVGLYTADAQQYGFCHLAFNIRFLGHCYWKNTRARWDSAQSNCESILSGSHLLTDMTEEKHQVLLTQFSDLDSFWLGLNDRAVEGNFVWDDLVDTPLGVPAQWDPATRNSDDKDCVAITRESGNKWVPTGCSISLPYVCEKDVDECQDNPCHEFAVCANTKGSFTCTCIDGYTGDGFTCAARCTQVCNPNARCRNIGGTNYGCMCNDGFEGDGITCNDINECLDSDAYHCHTEHGNCINTEGSFECHCNPGYKRAENNPLHECEDVDECHDIKNLYPCSVSAHCDNYVGGFRCDCNAGYTGDGYTCEDMDECAQGSHNCHANATCVNQDPINNPAGFTCTCKPGFEGDGITCTGGQCPTLAPPSNGALSPVGATSYRDVVTFTCNQGYELVGTSTVTCLSNLAWSHAVPTCRPVQCQQLTAPANGVLSPTGAISYQNGVDFSCNVGYQLNGASRATCQADQTWSANVPTCTVVQCPLLKAPANGTLSPAGVAAYNTVVSFTCVQGYVLTGAADVTCQADGTWSARPTCRPSSLQCPALLAPTNGILSPTGATSYQTVVTFTCNQGYLLDGASSATCQADGTWSHPVPTCRDINDCSPNPCKNGGDCTDLGNNFQCTCAAGYEGDTCQTDINDCIPNPCKNGGTCTDLVNDFQCSCPAGYSGDTCQSDGTPFGVWTLVGTAVGCLVAGVLLGVAALFLILRCRKAKSKTFDTAEDVYESVRTPGRAASQRSGTGSDAYYSYPMVPRPLPPPLPSQPRGHYQDLRPAVYQGLQKDRGASLPPQNNKGRKEISHNFT